MFPRSIRQSSSVTSGGELKKPKLQEGEFIEEFWQRGGGPHDFDTCRGLEIGPDSLLYVTDLNQGVFVFTMDGELFSHWLLAGQTRSPNDIAFGWDPLLNRNVAYVHDYGPVKYEILGGVIEDHSGGYGLADLATDREGNLYVQRELGSFHIEKYSPAFELLAFWGEEGTGPGQHTSSIAGIAIDDSGYVYVGDGMLNRVQKYRLVPPSGITETTWSALKGGAG